MENPDGKIKILERGINMMLEEVEEDIKISRDKFSSAMMLVDELLKIGKIDKKDFDLMVETEAKLTAIYHKIKEIIQKEAD